ncbi:MAG TPA: sigma-70 family RNA polymerase sigma factor [Solirubrobacterales bacterium]|nr:sigma-70 family RNA polymerase sigma factor [Solirubrobacterales bacterium]
MTAAEAFLADEYEESKAEVQRTVAAKLGRDGLAGVDLDAAYNEAWHALYLRLQEEEPVENPKGFLVTVTYRRALSERRAVRLEQATDVAELAAVGVEPDIDARLDAEMQLRHFEQGLRASLDGRELQAATLCHLHGLSRPEAAKVIGIAPRRMEKLMDRASKRISAVIGAVRPGELCEEFDSLVRAFAVGMLDEDGERYRLARDHLEGCPACRRKVLTLRGLGAITPPLPALLGVLGGAAGVGAVGVGAAGVGATKAGLGSAKGGAAKGLFGKLAGKAAGLSGKAALIGGAAATTTAVAAVAAATVISGGGGGHGAPAADGGGPAPAVGAAVAGAESEVAPAPTQKQPKRKHAKRDRAKRKPHPRHKRPHEAKASSTSPPPAAEPEPEATPTVSPEPTPEPTPEPAPEPAPEPSPEPEPAGQSEPQHPVTNASVEFELR